MLVYIYVYLSFSLAKKSQDFDHFVYSQEWPASVCLDSNLTVSDGIIHVQEIFTRDNTSDS